MTELQEQNFEQFFPEYYDERKMNDDLLTMKII